MDITTIDNVVIFAPHADDETIGCGGLIAKLCAQQKKVTLVMVSDSSGAGGLDSNASLQRAQEVKRAAAILGIREPIIFWNIPDGQVSEYFDLINKVKAIAKDKKGLSAFCPTPQDSHHDHSSVAHAVIKAHQNGFFTEGIWFYEVWTPLCATHILDISDVWSQKKEALSAHHTALQCADYLRGAEGLAMYRSLLGEKLAREGSFAEAFRFYKYSTSKETIRFRDAHEDDEAYIRKLFEEVFESIPPDGWWAWKYGKRDRLGSVGIRENGEIISFYGSLEREMIFTDKKYPVCQLGDVMVNASMRGWGGKKGVFYRTSFSFLHQYVGDGKTFSIGFGFPTPRALSLGIRLGLYQRADKLLHLQTQCQQYRLDWGVTLSCTPAKKIDNWDWMKRLKTPINHVVPNSAWMEKTQNYWHWRYGERPDSAYLVIRIARFGRTTGAAVLKETAGGMELMDIAFLGYNNYLNLLNGIIKFMSASPKRVLSAWGTELAIKALQTILGGETEDAGYLTLPGEVLEASMSNIVLNHLWLLGGDTDFR